MKKVEWRWDYGVYVPFCPYCDEPAYEHESCCFCGKPYKWIEGNVKPTEIKSGEYTVVQCTNNDIHLYKGGKLVMHSQCTEKRTKKELLEFIDFYKNLEVEEK